MQFEACDGGACHVLLLPYPISPFGLFFVLCFLCVRRCSAPPPNPAPVVCFLCFFFVFFLDNTSLEQIVPIELCCLTTPPSYFPAFLRQVCPQLLVSFAQIRRVRCRKTQKRKKTVLFDPYTVTVTPSPLPCPCICALSMCHQNTPIMSPEWPREFKKKKPSGGCRSRSGTYDGFLLCVP